MEGTTKKPTHVEERIMKVEQYVEQNDEYRFLKEVITKLPYGSYGVLLVGPEGSGKTLLGRCLAKDFQANSTTIDGSSQTDRRDLEGNWEIVNRETVFNKGPLLRAVESANKPNEKGEKIAFVIINEVNAIRPSEQISLNGLLSEEEMNLISKGGENIKLDDDAKLVIIGTMNVGVLGINPLQEAFFDRFQLILNIDYPNKNIEKKILKKITGCGEELAEIVSDMAFRFRNAQSSGYQLSKNFSTRISVEFIRVLQHIDAKYVPNVIKTMISNKLSFDGSEREYISNLIIGQDYEHRIVELM